jgi:hypothetical protein
MPGGQQSSPGQPAVEQPRPQPVRGPERTVRLDDVGHVRALQHGRYRQRYEIAGEVQMGDVERGRVVADPAH